jgi:hypothetical protein
MTVDIMVKEAPKMKVVQKRKPSSQIPRSQHIYNFSIHKSFINISSYQGKTGKLRMKQRVRILRNNTHPLHAINLAQSGGVFN